MTEKARRAGVKFAFEIHPGDSVYNTETFLKLREEVGAEETFGIDGIVGIRKV